MRRLLGVAVLLLLSACAVPAKLGSGEVAVQERLLVDATGWNRFDVAERMLQEMGQQSEQNQNLSQDFQRFLDKSAGAAAPKTQAERDALFRDFMAWQAQRSSKGRPRPN